MKKTIGFAILLAAFTFSFPEEKPQITVPLNFDHYYTLDQVYDALKACSTRRSVRRSAAISSRKTISPFCHPRGKSSLLR